MDGPGAHLQQRLRFTHDLHHTVLAIPVDVPEVNERLWNGIRFGLEVARLGPTLLAMRWEEGWDTPISIWRERLGLTDLLLQSPFQEELTLLC